MDRVAFKAPTRSPWRALFVTYKGSVEPKKNPDASAPGLSVQCDESPYFLAAGAAGFAGASGAAGLPAGGAGAAVAGLRIFCMHSWIFCM